MWQRPLLVGLVAAGFVGCNGATPVPELAKPPALNPDDQTTCKVKKSESKPLIVEWPSAERVALEARYKKGLVVVRYNGCEMQLLTRCTAPGTYDYSAVTPKRDSLRIKDEDELWAAIPIGAAGLEAKLQKAGELGVDMTMVGTFLSDRAVVDAGQLEGLCDGATHIVAGLTVGAFEFFAGGSAELGGGVDVAGVGAGAKSKASREMLGSDGTAAACGAATSSDEAPPEGCAALLRVEVVPLQGAAPTAAVPTTAAPPTTPAPKPAPPAGPSDAERAAMAPSGGARALLTLFLKAANAGSSYDQEKLVTSECWAAECENFAKQAGTKFQVKLLGTPTVRNDRAIATVDVVVKGKVQDQVYLYLLKTHGGWKVAWLDEDREHSGRFLTGQEPAAPRPDPVGTRTDE